MAAVAAILFLTPAAYAAGEAGVAAQTEQDQVARDQAGGTLYSEHCGFCHQPDGSGVPWTQPALVQSPKLNGDVTLTLEMILLGSEAVPIGTSDYSGQMPRFDGLSDEEIADVATYVRTHFDNSGSPVSLSDVVRARRLFTDPDTDQDTNPDAGK